MTTHGTSTYRCTIRWTTFWGARTQVSGGDFPSRAEGIRETLAMASASGWTPPRWWQWWRWEDTPAPREEDLP